MPKHRNGNRVGTNLGSLDCESGGLPQIYHESVKRNSSNYSKLYYNHYGGIKMLDNVNTRTPVYVFSSRIRFTTKCSFGSKSAYMYTYQVASYMYRFPLCGWSGRRSDVNRNVFLKIIRNRSSAVMSLSGVY